MPQLPPPPGTPTPTPTPTPAPTHYSRRYWVTHFLIRGDRLSVAHLRLWKFRLQTVLLTVRVERESGLLSFSSSTLGCLTKRFKKICLGTFDRGNTGPSDLVSKWIAVPSMFSRDFSVEPWPMYGLWRWWNPFECRGALDICMQPPEYTCVCNGTISSTGGEGFLTRRISQVWSWVRVTHA